MDIRNLQHEKALVGIIFDRDTMIEQLGAQAVSQQQANEALKKENSEMKARLDDLTGDAEMGEG